MRLSFSAGGKAEEAETVVDGNIDEWTTKLDTGFD